MLVLALAVLTLGIWLYLLLARGGFWRIRAADPGGSPAARPVVAAIVPARDEASIVGDAVRSLVAQDYDGPFQVFVVDDHSSDQTAAIAEEAGATVVLAGPLPLGWAGKVWAMSEGVRKAAAICPDFYLFTDADIVHHSHNLAGLLAKAETGLDLVSLMVRLRCRSLAECALVPAFVYFFFQLYPPSWIANPRSRTAGAAGGCMLVRAETLERAGGLKSIAGARIDDCALAARIKSAGGRLWLGASAATESVRDYPAFGDILHMISRSAYTQLRYSPLLLMTTVAGMLLTYITPILLWITPAWPFGLAAYLLMAASFVPVLRLYRRSPLWSLLVPAMAAFYVAATVHSAWRHSVGHGAEWKGRMARR
jgi:hopene-associated glycosyltransferase HpnB